MDTLFANVNDCNPDFGIQSIRDQQATASVIKREQQYVASQQPVQNQSIAGRSPQYNTGKPQQQQEYVKGPDKMAYATFPTHSTSSTPLLYGGTTLQQPTSVQIKTAVRPATGDYYLTLSILMTFLVLIVGSWPSLLCTISASWISYNANNDEKRGIIAAARAKAIISLGLNIAAVLFVVVMWSVVAIPIAVTISTASTVSPTSVSPSQYCYNATSSTYYCYQSNCTLDFHKINYICYYSNSYSSSVASNYYSDGYQILYYLCNPNYYLKCV